MSKSASKIVGAVIVLGLAIMSLGYLGFSIGGLSRRGFEFVVMAMLGGGAFFALMLLGPVGKAIAALLQGEGPHDEELQMRVEDLEARLAELSLEQQRVGELEERLDFAERLLSAREQHLLGGEKQ